MTDTLEALVADPRATLRAIDCVDARESFLTFCGMVEIPTALVPDPENDYEGEEESEAEELRYRPPSEPTAAHHIKLCGVLQAIAEGRVKRAMFFLCPGTAKSTYGSVLFPAWFMGRKKRPNVGVASYATPLAKELGRRTRSVVQQPIYRDISEQGLAPTRAPRTSGRWTTATSLWGTASSQAGRATASTAW